MNDELNSSELSELFVVGFRPFEEEDRGRLVFTLQSRLSSMPCALSLYRIRLMKMIGELKKLDLALSQIFFKQSEDEIYLIFKSGPIGLEWKAIKINLKSMRIDIANFRELHNAIEIVLDPVVPWHHLVPAKGFSYSSSLLPSPMLL